MRSVIRDTMKARQIRRSSSALTTQALRGCGGVGGGGGGRGNGGSAQYPDILQAHHKGITLVPLNKVTLC